MRSAEFYQVFGRIRQEELLAEAANLRARRLMAGSPGAWLPAGVAAVLTGLAALLGNSRAPRQVWMGKSITGKPVHG